MNLSEKLAELKAQRRVGSLDGLSMVVIIAVVTLFIGLFMIAKVSDVSSIDENSSFYTVYTGLVSSVATIYDVLIIVIIIVALGVAIAVLRGFGGSARGGGAAV